MRRFRSLTAPFAPGFSASPCRTNSTVNASSGETKKEKKASTIWQVDEQRKEKLANFGRYVAQCVPKFVQQVQVVPLSGYNEGSDSSWEKWAVQPSEYDILLTDIDDNELKKIGKEQGIENLSPGSFPSPAFPVRGVIYGIQKRLMICLACRRAGKINAPIVNVWFLVDTGSPYTFLSKQTTTRLAGSDAVDDYVRVAIQIQESIIESHLSHAHFSEVNLLGMNALRKLTLSVDVNWKEETFQLVQK